MSVTYSTNKQLDVIRDQGDEAVDASGRLSFDEDGRGGSPELIAVYVKAKDLAETLGHSTIEIPHLLMAFTLTPEGLVRLKEDKIDETIVRRNCWMALGIQPSQPDSRSPITFSSDLRAVNTMASQLAKRNDKTARMVQMRQVLEVLGNERFKDTVGPLLASIRPAPTPEEIRLNVESIKHYVEEQFPLIKGKCDLVSSLVAHVAREVVTPPMADGSISTGQPTARSMLADLRSAIHEGPGKLENKIRNVKTVALFGAAFGIFNLIAILTMGVLLFNK